MNPKELKPVHRVTCGAKTRIYRGVSCEILAGERDWWKEDGEGARKKN